MSLTGVPDFASDEGRCPPVVEEAPAVSTAGHGRCIVCARTTGPEKIFCSGACRTTHNITTARAARKRSDAGAAKEARGAVPGAKKIPDVVRDTNAFHAEGIISRGKKPHGSHARNTGRGGME